ncbi:FG-GAP-like repeat-containing protein [Roseivirga sp. E12]|uniref:FG-GAP-like repeat-containing protein n=1 Tax=Roseivirga sp. E12 TaxID=2819237 RepID=UPI001ABBF563|nr:FG-GAP-like repeat-containing protein [Roseivirga sp. E12]MBO3700245.1 T9SS type A sorting domain-containing protein [Roseivirga sp. E12]
MRSALFLIILSFPLTLMGQFQFRYKTDVPFSNQGTPLERAWEGGLNAAQFQTMDLNNDGTEDLILYNRISRDISTYLNVNDQYIWSPDFAYLFPDDVVHWLILKDYDCDGLKDLFTSTALGIKVYRNTSAGASLTWEVAQPFLRFDAGTNIQVSPNDIPGIADINGDGALDILTYRFGTSTTVDYFQNTGACGSLEFTRVERQWGGFTECDCDSFVFGGALCPTPSSSSGTNGGEAILHAGGKTLLPFDADNDGDIDLISSDEFCESLYFLENVGDNLNAQMTTLSSFPFNNPAGFKIFPGAFLEDINFDGLMDLIISTNADENIGNQIDLRDNVKVYTNNGSATVPVFDQASSPFLQNEMIDLGENAFPAFNDLDGDGDLDFVVGNKGFLIGTEVAGSLSFIDNVGNRFTPSFDLTDMDFQNLEGLNYQNVKPQFVDADNDGDLDLFYQATQSNNETRIFLQEMNSGTLGATIEVPINTSFDDNPFFYDIDNDDDLDLLVGKSLGSLSLFVNEGNFNFGAEITNFGGISNNFQALNLWPHVADLDGDGEDELVTLDASGLMNIYPGPINQNFVATNPSTEVLSINNIAFATRFGRQNSITSADIFNTGRPALIIGSGKGGLYLLENISQGGGGSGNEIQIELSPNPTNDEITVLTNTDGFAEIYDITGRKKHFNINIQSGVSKVLRLGSLPVGLYILRVVNNQNESATRKILVYR